MRILLDTNILARAAPGPPSLANEIVLAATRHDHTLLLSPFLVSELDRVLRYDRLRRTHGLDDSGIEKYLADLILVAEIVLLPAETTPVIPADPEDEPIIATAIVGQADVLCTRDRHFFRADVVAHCRAHRVQVLTDLELLAQLKRT